VLLLKCCYFFRRKIQFTLKTKDSTIVVPERINQQRMVVEIVSQPIVQQFTLPEQSRQTYHWQILCFYCFSISEFFSRNSFSIFYYKFVKIKWKKSTIYSYILYYVFEMFKPNRVIGMTVTLENRTRFALPS
jgi:hypothetical protein